MKHFTPLFVTLGAATDPTESPTTPIDSFAIGLAKRSIQPTLTRLLPSATHVAFSFP